MKQIVRKSLPLSMLLLAVVLLAACTMPSSEENDAAAQQTAVAQTVEASLATAVVSEEPTTAAAPTATTAVQTTASTQATSAVTQTPEEETVGDDRAEFIADVTIQDYSEQVVEDEITKTWRIRNVGETTWTTDYYLEFEKGDQMGADAKVYLTEDVAPNAYTDLSIDFTVPADAGEYASYWRLRNGDGELVGIDEENTPLSLYTVINAVEEGGDTGDTGDGGSSSSGGIAGGATVTGATVSVDDASYSGSCPGQVTFTYTVTTSTAGNVNFYLNLTPSSPAGYSFDATPEYSIAFTGGYTVTYTYTLFSNSSVSATAKVIAEGDKTFTSSPINFTINCN